MDEPSLAVPINFSRPVPDYRRYTTVIWIHPTRIYLFIYEWWEGGGVAVEKYSGRVAGPPLSLKIDSKIAESNRTHLSTYLSPTFQFDHLPSSLAGGKEGGWVIGHLNSIRTTRAPQQVIEKHLQSTRPYWRFHSSFPSAVVLLLCLISRWNIFPFCSHRFPFLRQLGNAATLKISKPTH